MGNLITMLKRRTSKRFVLGDTTEEASQNYEQDESTEVIPSNLLQKFQMTLEAEAEQNSKEEDDAAKKSKEDGRFLRLPAPTLQ